MKEKLESLLDNDIISVYYHFPVAAIVKTKDGREYSGINIENAIPALSDCAERVAIYSALTDKVKGEDIEEIHVMAKNANHCMPCLTCRQIMLEHAPDIKIHTYSNDGSIEVHKLADVIVKPYTKDGLEPYKEVI